MPDQSPVVVAEEELRPHRKMQPDDDLCGCALFFTEASPATNRALTRRERPFARFDLKSGAEDPLPPAQDTVEPAVDLSSRLPSLPCPYY